MAWISLPTDLRRAFRKLSLRRDVTGGWYYGAGITDATPTGVPLGFTAFPSEGRRIDPE
jgi:hypothetical protein